MHTSGIVIDKNGREWFRFRNGHVLHGALVADAEFIAIPQDGIDLFANFAEHVEMLELSHLDKIDAKIEAYGLNVVWDGSTERIEIHDVQLFGGQVSFRPGLHQNWE